MNFDLTKMPEIAVEVDLDCVEETEENNLEEAV
mgnify:CR=1 FL=1